jgi:UDPglucose 6-dehydrogenase
MRLAVFGSGYVGLVTGACFSDFGNHVTLVDIDPSKVERLKSGEIPIYEPGLAELVQRNERGGRLHFTTHAEEALKDAEIVFVAVGTPERPDGTAGLRFVEDVARTVAKSPGIAGRDVLFVLKSTVPVGTADRCRKILPSNVDVVNNPEFLKEGSAVTDFLRPERVVIGTASPRSQEMMQELYRPFVRTGAPMLVMSNRSAEVSKYAANSFLALKVSFINDLAIFAEKAGANIYDVRSVMINDSRIGKQFLHPGAGYGGSCFPKDVQALAHTAREMGSSLPLVEATHTINQRQRQVMPARVLRYLERRGLTRGARVAIWGVAFKPETDDIREAPALVLIDELVKAGHSVAVYDPQALGSLERERSSEVKARQIETCANAEAALRGSHVLAVMTEWNEFRSPSFESMSKELSLKAVFDGKNIYREATLERYGLTHFGIGFRDFGLE